MLNLFVLLVYGQVESWAFATDAVALHLVVEAGEDPPLAYDYCCVNTCS